MKLSWFQVVDLLLLGSHVEVVGSNFVVKLTVLSMLLFCLQGRADLHFFYGLDAWIGMQNLLRTSGRDRTVVSTGNDESQDSKCEYDCADVECVAGSTSALNCLVVFRHAQWPLFSGRMRDESSSLVQSYRYDSSVTAVKKCER